MQAQPSPIRLTRKIAEGDFFLPSINSPKAKFKPGSGLAGGIHRAGAGFLPDLRAFIA
ncbi:hypothetical protein GTP91_14250 [Rugamonas sp. FT82W]|uniref:Uncharacterized protein n=1 Tax=Duganella vulcania TaxID=2692166 RepID=A0A845G0W1_9BURK|nr:hypothetical protein [Duganella vulcania]MYM88333.1 hypothetical protein [Duganella vulcania]